MPESVPSGLALFEKGTDINIPAYREELTAELEAFEHDFAKLAERLDEIDREVYPYVSMSNSKAHEFLIGVRIAKDHVISAWRSAKYANQNINGK